MSRIIGRKQELAQGKHSGKIQKVVVADDLFG